MFTDCDSLHRILTEQVVHAFRCKFVKNHLRIAMPFVHADGDAVSVHVFIEDNHVRISDLGAAMSRLRQMGLEPRRARLNQLLRGLGVTLDGESLTMVTSEDSLLSALILVGQAMSSLAAISFGIPISPEPLREVDHYISQHNLKFEREFRFTVEVETNTGVSIKQHPKVDFFIQDDLILMTIPGNKARLRKFDKTFKSLSILERGHIKLPKVTVYDVHLPPSREDSDLLSDLSALIPNSFLTSDLSFDELRQYGAERKAILVPSLV